MKGFARPVECYRLDGLRTPDTAAAEAVTLAGRHVSVNIPHRHQIGEAMEELRRMQEDLARRLPEE
jgi:hypothetical protein